MTKGIWIRWQWLFAAVLVMMCLSCQPTRISAPLPPPPPPAAPEPSPARPTVYVKVGRLNLRAGPGMDFPKIGLLERNEELEKLGQTEDWVQVRVKRDRTLGWVASEFLSSTPVAAPIETATPEPPPPPPPPPPSPPKEPSAAEPKRPKPPKVETVTPKASKPAEAAEPPAPKSKAAPEPAPSPEPKTAPAKPAPPKEEPPPTPAPQPPEEKPSRIRIM